MSERLDGTTRWLNAQRLAKERRIEIVESTCELGKRIVGKRTIGSAVQQCERIISDAEAGSSLGIDWLRADAVYEMVNKMDQHRDDRVRQSVIQALARGQSVSCAELQELFDLQERQDRTIFWLRESVKELRQALKLAERALKREAYIEDALERIDEALRHTEDQR